VRHLKSPASPGRPTRSAAFRFPETLGGKTCQAKKIIQRQFLFTTRVPCRKVIFAFKPRPARAGLSSEGCLGVAGHSRARGLRRYINFLSVDTS